jgi:predicted enzyme related to lactoylglutathione lyase
MPERSYPPGTFCWFEMVASDQSVARTFYTTLFGWTPLEIPVPGEGTYTALKLGDDVVAGLFGIDDEMRSQGVLPHWLSYVSVADVDAAAARLAELGGRVVAGPVDANGQGRMVVAEDPMGAALGLWQPKAFAGSQRFREPGSPSWTELMTRDEGAALEFYRGLFGWATRVAPGAAGQSYTHFLASGGVGRGAAQLVPLLRRGRSGRYAGTGPSAGRKRRDGAPARPRGGPILSRARSPGSPLRGHGDR